MSFRYITEYFDDDRKKGRAVDLMAPANPTRETAVFFVHGGGYRGGDRENFHTVKIAFNEMGYFCASTDYRLTGSDIFDQLADVRDGYRFFLRFLEENGRPPKVTVFGTSAGAHLAGLLALAKPGVCGEPKTGVADGVHAWVPPVGLALQATPVTFEPWEEIFPPVWEAMQDIVGKPYDEAPELYRKISLVNYVRPGICPVFMMEAECEHMFPRTMSADFAEKIRAAGGRADFKVYATAEHGFIYDVARRVQKEAVADLAAFVESL